MSAIGLMAPPPIGFASFGDDPDERECRICGCTQDDACVVDGQPCSWVDVDLCSACADHVAPSGVGGTDG